MSYSSLMRAVAFGTLEEVERICLANPDVLFYTDAKGRTALDWARMTRKLDVIAYLNSQITEYINVARTEEIGLPTNDSASVIRENALQAQRLMKYIRARNVEDILRLFGENTVTRDAVADNRGEIFFADHESNQGDTPLILAAGYNMIPVVNELIALGCAIDKTNKYGHSAFTWACLCGHGEMVRTLLLQGANAEHQTNEGRTGLHYACLYAKARVVGVILDVMYERFGAWRSKNPTAIMKFDPSRWTKYSITLENFLEKTDGRQDTALDLLPEVDAGTISKFISPGEVQSLCYSIVHVETGTHLDPSPSVEINIEAIGTKNSVARNVIKAASAEGSLSFMTGAGDADNRARLQDTTMDDDVDDPLAGLGLEEEQSFFGSEFGGLENDPVFEGAEGEVTERDGTANDWNNFRLETSGVDLEDARKLSADALLETQFTGGSMLIQGGDMRAPSSEPFISENNPTIDEPASVTFCEDNFESFDSDSVFASTPRNIKRLPDGAESADLKDFLADAHSVRSVMSLDTEVSAILKVMAEAFNRIRLWRHCAAREVECNAPVPCWLGCGFIAKYAAMCKHVGNKCPLRPVECVDCHEMQQANLLASHRKECDRRIVACLNAWTGCREQVRYDYLDTHLNLRCQTRLVNCRLNCGAKVKFCLRVDHEQNHCMKRLITCWQCEQQVISAEITHHLHETCLSRLIKCSVGCGQMILAGELDHHENEVCRQFCKWNCGNKFGPPEILQLHELLQCPLRAKKCDYNCGMDEFMTAGYVEEHMRNHCSHTPLVCPNLCAIGKLLRKDIPRHIDPIRGDCSERYVRCPSNFVGWRVLVDDILQADATTAVSGQYGIVLRYKRFPVESDQDTARIESDNFPPAIKWDGIDKLYIRFENGQKWVEFWKNSITLVEKVTGDKISKKYNFNEKFDCGFIVAGDLNQHLHEECRHRNVYIGAKVPLTAAEVEKRLAREAEEALIVEAESAFSVTHERGANSIVGGVNSTIGHGAVHNIPENLNDDEVSVMSENSTRISTAVNKKRFKKRTNSLFMNKDMNDISYCVEIMPRKIPDCCGSLERADPDHICAKMKFIGQQTEAKKSVQMAFLRQDVNEFLQAPADAITCEHCSVEVAPDKLEWHIARDCGHVLSRCGFGCGAKMIRRELPIHMNERCPKRFITCVQCSNQLWAEELETHLSNGCLQRCVSCPLGCSDNNILAKDVEEHTIESCVNRMITCLCGERVIFKEWPEHDVADCVKKLGQCPQGCGQRIPRDEMSLHMEKTCENKHVWLLRPVKCPIGCGQRMKYIDILDHVSFSCSKRLLDCPYQCGNVVKYDKMAVHLRLCPLRQVTCEKGSQCCKQPLFLWFKDKDYRLNRSAFNGETGNWEALSFGEDLSTMQSLTTSAESEVPSSLILGDDTYASNQLNGKEPHQHRTQTYHPQDRIMSAGMPTSGCTIPYGGDDVSSVNSADDMSHVSTIPPSDQIIHGDMSVLKSSNIESTTLNGTNQSMADAHGAVYQDIEGSGVFQYAHEDSNAQYDDSGMQTTDPESDQASKFASLGGNLHKVDDDLSMSQGVVAVSRQQTEQNFRDKMTRTGSKKMSTRSSRDPMKTPESSVLVQNGVICFKSSLTLSRCEKHQRTLLMYCIRFDDFVLANYILSQISENELDFENIYGDTALTLASRTNKLKFVELLVTHNVNVNRETDNGRTALSEAVKEGHAAIVDFLIDNGASVMLKTIKHQRSAMDWGEKVGTVEIKRILKLGAMVQEQVKEIFYAIGCGDVEKVDKLVDDGDFFGPQNTTALKEKMETKLQLVYSLDKECKEKREEVKEQKKVIAAIAGRTKTATDRLAAAQKNTQDAIHRQLENDKSMSTRFNEFESIAGVMVPRDLSEIALIRSPDELVRNCALAFGLLIGPTLDINSSYNTSKKSMKKWWPKVAEVFLESAMTIKRIRLFSWAILLSPHSSALCERLNELNHVIQGLIGDAVNGQSIRDQQREARRRVRAAEIALARQKRREEKEARRLEMINESLELHRTERKAMNAAKARKKELEDELARAQTAQGINDLTALLNSGKASPMKELPKPPTALVETDNVVDPLDWDSDAEGQGDGDWVAGEWVPKPFVRRKHWWKKVDQESGDSSAKSPDTKVRQRETQYSDAVVIVQAGEARSVKPPKKTNNNKIVFLSDPGNKPLVSTLTTDAKALSRKNSDNISVSYPDKNLEVSAADQADEGDDSDDGDIRVILSDDEDEAKLRSEQTYNLQFVQCISVLVKCCCSLIADLPTFRQAAEDVTAKRKELDDVVTGTASDITRSKTEELRKKILEKEYSQCLDRKKEGIVMYQKYKNKARIARLMNQVTLTGHTAVSWAAAVGSYDIVEVLLSRGAPVGYTENLIHMSASVIQISYRLYRCTYHGQKKKMLIRLKAQKQAKALAEGRDLDQEELLAMLDYDENMTEQEITQVMAEKLDDEVMLAMKIGDDSFGSGEKIIEKMFELKINLDRVLSNLRRIRSKHRFPVPEAAMGGHWEIVRRIYDRRLLHARMSSSWCSLSTAVPRPLPFPQVPHDPNKSVRHFDLLEICEIAMTKLGTTNSIPQMGWTPSVTHHRSMFQESLNECTEVWRLVTEASDKFRSERHRYRILREDQLTKARNKQLMTRAIHAGKFYKCMELATTERSSIDFETASNLTALIVASEENLGGLNHSFVINDERQPVLAVCYLLDRDFYKPVINLETANGDTALLHACSQGRINVVEALLDRGADINRQNKFGQCSLHVAAKNGSVRCVKLLLERGADATLQDIHGRIPSDIAFEKNFTDVTMAISQFRGGFFGPVAAARGRVIEEIYCPTGCGTRLMPFEVKDHLLNCDQREIECQLGCGIRHLLKREEEEHISTTCSERPIVCSDCKEPYPYSQEKDHLNNKCKQRLILCPLNCEDHIPFCELKKHFLFCPYRIIDCPNAECDEKIPFILKGLHLRQQCNYRKVSCPLRCLALVTYIAVPNHVSTVCQLRPIKCKWCDKEYKFIEIQDHELKCTKRGVDCTAGCGECVREADLREHLLTTCNNRFVPCESRCGLKVRQSDMESHLESHCANRLVICPNACYDSSTKDVRRIIAKRMDVHISLECPNRVMRCGLCTEDIKACELTRHSDFNCPKRIVSCRIQGCSKQLPMCDRDNHELYKCKFRHILCENGCDERVRVVQMKTHLARRCDMRYLKCPLECGMQIRRRNMYMHLSEHCEKRNMLFVPPPSPSKATAEGIKKGRRGKPTVRPGTATVGEFSDELSLGSNSMSLHSDTISEISRFGTASEVVHKSGVKGDSRTGTAASSRAGTAQTRTTTAGGSRVGTDVTTSSVITSCRGDSTGPANGGVIDKAIRELLSVMDGAVTTTTDSVFSQTV